jgi:hypothetical protein
VVEHLPALTVFETPDPFDLDRALQVGMLPGVYLDAEAGTDLLGTYAETYLREEIRGEALVREIGDYARFLEMIRNGGVLDGVRILAPRTVELMTTNQVGTLHSATGLGFGLGFETTDRYGANGLDPVNSLRVGRREVPFIGWIGAGITILMISVAAEHRRPAPPDAASCSSHLAPVISSRSPQALAAVGT